jgi:hypothetical protein
VGGRLRLRSVGTSRRAGLVMLATVWLLAGCGAGARAGRADGIPRRLLLEARPIGRGPRFRPPVTGSVVGACRRELGARFGVHVEVFGADRVVIVPAGIGVRPPIRLSAGRISSAGCYGSLVTLEPTGLVLVRPGARLSLSDLFRAWGQPLSSRRLAPFAAARGGQVAVFLDGQRWRGQPGGVPLVRHSEIVLEEGAYVPPHSSYTFPPGTCTREAAGCTILVWRVGARLV